MPIEFRCPACGKLLRTPDGSEGKQARCPGCGGTATVPAGPMAPGGLGGAPGGVGAEAGGFGAPLSGAGGPAGGSFSGSGAGGFDSGGAGGENPFGSPSPGAGGEPVGEPFNPYAAPQASSLPPPGSFQPSASARTGPVWEREPRSFGTYWQTIKDGFDPNRFFDDMRREGGLGAPMTFAVISGMIGMVGSLCQNLVIQGLPLMAGGNQGPGQPDPVAVFGIVAAVGLGCLVVMPLFIILGLYINSGLTHLFLGFLKGANFPFETTFRVVAYSMGITSVLQIIPCVGGVAGIVQIVWVCIGLARAHETSGGKAVGAVLLPIVTCACLIIGGGILTAVLIAAANR